MNGKPERKRWDRLGEQLLDAVAAGEHGPPYPALLSDAIWLVFRIDPEVVTPLVPAGIKMSPSAIGVLGVFAVPTGSVLSPYVRSICAVAIEGYDAPDTKEAAYIVGDVVSARAEAAMRLHYVADGLVGAPRLWWDDGLLHGAVSTGGVEWLHAVVRPSAAAQPDVTGIDAYVSRSGKGLNRHIVSYFGAVAPTEVVSLTITEDAPAGFRAMRGAEIVLGLTASGLNATWGEALPIADFDLAPAVSRKTSPRDPVDLLNSVRLTPAEARLAVLVGKGSSAKEAASQLGISQHTARSTMKLVYGKLGIRKQSELGHLIARLQFGAGD